MREDSIGGMSACAPDRRWRRDGGLRGAASPFSPSSLLAPIVAGAGIDPETWTPEHIRSIVGTETVDTAAECSGVVPLDHEGRLTFWYVGPTQAEPELHRGMAEMFWETFEETYPRIGVRVRSIGCNDMLDELRTAALGNAAPMAARMPILWGVEFAAEGQLVMMIAHPSEYANMLDRASHATGTDAKAAQKVVDDMRHGRLLADGSGSRPSTGCGFGCGPVPSDRAAAGVIRSLEPSSGWGASSAAMPSTCTVRCWSDRSMAWTTSAAAVPSGRVVMSTLESPSCP